MANIKPFRGYRYNKDKISNLGDVVSPPYYNLKKEDRNHLYEASEYNSVRLFSGKNYDGDDDINNKFTRAAKSLNDWIKDDILKRDPIPAIYMYEQTMEVGDASYSNRSFVALVEIEPPGDGGIMTCEEIRDVSLQDRYDFLTATNANLSMISCLYMEREKNLFNLMNELSEEKPDFEFDSSDNVHQRLWVITYQPTIEYIVNDFKDLSLYITDGQTRYQTCWQYRNYMKANNPNHTGKEPYNYAMVSLVNAKSDGLVILPVHRLINCPRGFREDYFISTVQNHFKIEKIIVDEGEDSIAETMKKQIATPRNETRIAMYCGGNYFYRLTLIDKDYIKKDLLPQMSKAYCSLDVVALNKLILKDILRITDGSYDEVVTSTRSHMECLESVKNGSADVMFILNPVKTEQIKNVTAAGERLPNSTLSVFPKPSVGVLINVLDE